MKDQRIVLLLLLCLIADSNSQACSDPSQQLVNTVVYEGNSTSFSNLFDLTGVTWQIYPSYGYDPINNPPPFTIADNNVPQSPFIGYYGVTPTQLTIPYASIYTQSSDSYSSAGVYILTYKTDPTCQAMASLIVVSNGPVCLCTPATDSDSAQLSCELDYGMASQVQQYATMTWYDESGNQVGYPETPTAYPKDLKYYSSESALLITSSGAASYTCGVTFTAPNSAPDGFARNAPTFNASCTVANCAQKIVPTTATTTTTAAVSNSQGPACSDPNQQLVNTVVYEGESTSFSNLFDLTGVTWQIYPSYDPINDFDNPPPFTIADDNIPQPPFIGYYGITPTQLSIPIASIDSRSSNPYSSAGVYVLTYKTDPTCQAMANLIVVSKGPVCQCTATDSSNAVLSCKLEYGTARNARMLPNRAKMTWNTACGQVSSETPEPNQNNAGYDVSTSAYSITSFGAATYTCGVTFNAPDSGTLANMAANAPSFFASCTIANCVKP